MKSKDTTAPEQVEQCTTIRELLQVLLEESITRIEAGGVFQIECSDDSILIKVGRRKTNGNFSL